MGTRKRSSTASSSDRETWKRIFQAMVDMTRTQQRQIESLAEERKFLENRIRLQYDKWVSDVKLFNGQISQMERHFELQKMVGLFEGAKTNLFLSMKQKEALTYKLRLEDVNDEREDLRALFDDLASSLEEPKLVKRSNNDTEEPRHVTLESELKRLRLEKRGLESSKNSEISALVSERDFVWNQYNKMEKDLNKHSQWAQAQLELADEKTRVLLTRLEELESTIIQKDKLIVTLKDDMAKLESDSINKSEKISELSRELESLRKSRSDSITPLLRHCTAGARKSGLGVKDSNIASVTTKKDLEPSQIVVKGSRRSKRKAAEEVSASKTPRLFTSSFKIPKLKSPSPASSTPELSCHPVMYIRI